MARVETLKGKFDGNDKWLGGVASPCGRYIYGVPGHAQRVLRITVETGVCDLIGPKFPGKFKWLRGVPVPADKCSPARPQGLVFALPCCAAGVLQIDPATEEVTVLPCEKGSFAWHGGELGADGRIYGVPANAEKVLVIDPVTSEVSYVGGPFPGRQKWYGGILAANDCMYCIPHMATGILKVDTRDGSCEVFGSLPEGGWKWHGGSADRARTTVYGFPNNADSVLKVDVATDAIELLPGTLESGRHRVPQDHKYKWLGGAVARDGNLYCFPCDAERVLRIDTETRAVSTVGPDFVFPLADYPLPRSAPKAASNASGMNVSMSVNKWQNGFVLEDGAVYGIPQRARGILRLLPAPEAGGEPEVTLLDCGQADHPIDLFEGGVLGSDGCMYCIPLRGRSVVKVVPDRTPDTWFPETRRWLAALGIGE